MPLAYFQARRTGDFMSRATNDLNAVRQMVGPAVMYSANTLLGFVVALAVMISIDARLTLFSLIPLPFVSLSVKYFGTAIHRRFEEIQAQLSEVSAITQEALSGVRVVRAYRQEQSELERFRQANVEYVRRNRRLIAVQGFFFPSMAFFLGLGSMLVLWLGSADVVAGRITIGEFVAFNAYLTMLAWPMIAFGWVTNMLQRGMASWKRMLEVMDAVPAIKDETRTQREQRTQSAEAQSCGAQRSAPLRWRLSVRLSRPRDPRRNRIPGPGVQLQRHADSRPRLGEDRGRADGCLRRRHRIGQVDADQPDRPAARSAAGDGVRRRDRRPGDAACRAP